MTYYRKELPQRTLTDNQGKRVEFEILNESVGVFKSEDGDILSFLEGVAGSQGVIQINKTDYDALKKKTRLENIQKAGLKKSKPPSSSANKSTRPRAKSGCRSCGSRRIG